MPRSHQQGRRRSRRDAVEQGEQLNMATTSKVAKCVMWRATNGEYYWDAKARNGAKVLTGGERLTKKKRLVEFLQGEWPHASIDVLDENGKLVQTIPASTS